MNDEQAGLNRGGDLAGAPTVLGGRWTPIQFVAAVGLVFLFAFTLILSLAPVAGGERVVGLDGPWQLVEVDGAPTTGIFTLPGLLADQGMSPSARVSLRRVIEIPAARGWSAVWVESPLYATRLSLDGEEIGASGDPDGVGAASRSETGVLARLPHSPGPHTLQLDLKGGYGKGGMTGRILMGPEETLRGVAKEHNSAPLGLSVIVALLGILWFRVALGSPARLACFWFGCFACVLSAWSFLQTESANELLPSVSMAIRLRRLLNPFLGPLGITMFSSLVYGAPPRWTRAYIGLGVCLAVPALFVPDDSLFLLERVQDGSLVLLVVAAFWIMGDGIRKQIPGVLAFALVTFPPLLVGASVHVAMTHGTHGGNSFMYTALTLFIVAVSAFMGRRFIVEADWHARLLALSSDAIVYVEQGGRVFGMNPAAHTILGEIPEQSMFVWADRCRVPLMHAHIERGAAAVDRAEFCLGTGQEQRFVESVATPLGTGSALLVLRDVTRRRQLDEGMQHASKMETIGRLVGGLAHDFNNMLSVLLAHVSLLQLRLTDAPEADRLIRMEAAIVRASQLSRRLLTVAGKVSLTLEPVQLEKISRSACELVEPTLRKTVTLHRDGPETLPPILGSEADLEQVLVNLLVNAHDAVGPSGQIWVRTRSYALPNGATGAMVIVEDDGPGVPLAQRESIFEPFVTTKGANKGTGLGLAMAAKVLRDHNGRLWFEERPGGGARFCVALRSAPRHLAGEPALPVCRDVLLVEDEEATREACAAELIASGFVVTAVSTAEAALEVLATACPAVLVTDVVMPGMSGIDLAVLATVKYPSLAVLLVSGFIPERLVPQLERGSWWRLDKPVRPERIVATVRAICLRQESASDASASESPLLAPLNALRAEYVLG